MHDPPLVTVGMPTCNRPELLKRSLGLIQAQSYPHLEIIVSDNASSDPRVSQLVLEAAAQDPRITFYRQDTNIGPSANFVFVLTKARGSFFMWAADDDEWHPSFIERLLDSLLSDSASGLAFCDFDVRYPDGSICDLYGSFTQAYAEFLCVDGPSRISAYVLQAPERGKANLIYGLFRREALVVDEVVRYFHSKAWGADMLFICDVLSRWSFSLVPDKLYTVGIPFSPPPPAAAVPPSSPAENQHRRRCRLAISHLRYFATYLLIMARAPGSDPGSTAKMMLRLLPVVVRWLREDFTIR